mmetsp:Transcript_37093/g.89034  ORF Transcript_37093/g.89034 Transcript_37093/m.89034 type:complete len:201 (-) Transcript_37093:396-998(-)
MSRPSAARSSARSAIEQLPRIKAWEPGARRVSKACSREGRLSDQPMMRIVTGDSPKSCGPSGDRGPSGTGAATPTPKPAPAPAVGHLGAGVAGGRSGAAVRTASGGAASGAASIPSALLAAALALFGERLLMLMAILPILARLIEGNLVVEAVLFRRAAWARPCSPSDASAWSSASTTSESESRISSSSSGASLTRSRSR